MAKKTIQYVCNECGSVYPKWAGQCVNCKAWNCLHEESIAKSPPKGLGNAKGANIAFQSLQGKRSNPERHKTGISELDRVCGGGLVHGCAILIGGDPGIGKSTILLQTAASLAKMGKNIAYISGEEAVDQIRLRAERLELTDAPVNLASATNIRDIITTMDDNDLDVVIIDSVQTMYMDNIDSAPGTVSQVRACSNELIRVAKQKNICLFLVGHVTKEGNIAGPRVMEHMVDTVLYFEGDRGHPFRILRAVKNRFGATDEIGVFEMTNLGLIGVSNPSELFLANRNAAMSGSVVYAGIEGSRPVLVEIQALVVPTSYGTPRRSVIGWDSNRLAMILAVLESRCGIQFGQRDVFLNVAGGLKINEPGADLAAAAALISALTNTPMDTKAVFFGEVALSGEIRAVSQMNLRLKEAEKLGFEKAHMPRPSSKREKLNSHIASCYPHIYEILPHTGVQSEQNKTKAV